jgi:Ca-activated chloride channel homolog
MGVKAWRVVPAAALLGCACLASATVGAADARAAWSDLWRTPDQQGQALLDAGEPAQAAARFHDPRRRAYADLEAGRDQDAAKLLAPFTDPESEYNRGNALARSGELQAALAAYDAALQQDPADKDTRHNRDLVERALRHARASPRSSGKGGQSGSSGQKRRSAAGQRNGSGSQSGGSSQRSGGQSQQSAAPGPQSAGGQASAANDSRSGTTNPGADSNRQARRDAAEAAALARLQQRSGRAGNRGAAQSSGRGATSKPTTQSARKGPDTAGLLAGGTRTPKPKPETERQLALDQWLRQIPDSPAGLLQRKFLIEHMMRQQQSGNPEGDD